MKNNFCSAADWRNQYLYLQYQISDHRHET